MTGKLHTIGHSTHSKEKFLDLLRAYEVTMVVDVRSLPYSRWTPHFNREALEPWLDERGISYLFLGEELGGRPRDPSCYVDGRVQYDLVAKTPFFARGIERVLSEMKTHSIALMCAEKDPLDCHRTLLVSRNLAERGASIVHILEDGKAESHDDAMERLLREEGGDQLSMFGSNDKQAAIVEAMARRAGRIAYTKQPEQVTSSGSIPR